MAYFVREASSALTPIQHSNTIFRNALKTLDAVNLIGAPGSGKPIIVDTTLKAKPGDTVRYHFIPYNEVAPLVGQDTTVTGNENSISEYYVGVTVEEYNWAFKKKGKMTDQRVIFNAREELTRQIQQNIAQFNDSQIFRTLSGYGLATDTTVSTDRVNGVHRCARCTGTSGATAVTAANSDETAVAGAMTSGDKLNVKAIEDAVILAMTATGYKVSPMRIGPENRPAYMLFVDPRAARDLRRDPEWINHALALVSLGLPNDYLGTGVLGVWNNVIVKMTERVKRFTVDSGTNYYARNLLVGADAMVLAWAQTTDYVEQWEDYERELGATGSEIRGHTKLYFGASGSEQDLGVFQLCSASN